MKAYNSTFLDIRNSDDIEKKIKPFFSCSDAAVWKLVVNVFQNCIFGKIFPPEQHLKYHWVSPGGKFRGQWIWDTMFVVDLLSIIPNTDEIIRGVFQNYWDFQDRWNSIMPEFAQDMIACTMRPQDKEWETAIPFSQIPIIAWGLERVVHRNNDMLLIKQSIARLERFHNWYWRERDVLNIGLCTVGAYSGDIQQAKYETFDYECYLDDLKLTPHPMRQHEKNRKWYGDLLLPEITAYLILSEQSLINLAGMIGDKDMQNRRQKKVDKSIEAMRKHLWDEEAGTFLAVSRETFEKVRTTTIGSWIPLVAGVPTPLMAVKMAEVLDTPEWMTPLPVPTVGRTDPKWNDGKCDDSSKCYWRGDVWHPTNYQIASGLAKYGFKSLSTRIVDATVANAIKHGISEHYHCDSGKPLGVPNLGMSCSVLTMMVDNLSSKYNLGINQ